MNKKMYMKNVLKLMIMMMLIILSIPSTIFAAGNTKKTATYVYEKPYYKLDGGSQSYEGIEDNPIIFDPTCDEIVVQYDEKGKGKQFYFSITPDSAEFKYIKYMVTILEDEKKIVFKRLSTSSDLNEFLVTPNKAGVGMNFIQPGAMYNENFDKNRFNIPLYKIESIFKFNINGSKYKQIETVLGNSTLRSGANASGDDSHSKVYVFSVSRLPENEIVQFSSKQCEGYNAKAVITVKEIEELAVLAISLALISDIVSCTSRPLATKVLPVSTISTIASVKPSKGASSTEPSILITLTSIFLPAKNCFATLGYFDATVFDE